jgi:hypothetical protein
MKSTDERTLEYGMRKIMRLAVWKGDILPCMSVIINV